MIDCNVSFIQTLSPLVNIESFGVKAGIPAFAVEKTQRVKPAHLESLRMAREAGVIIAMGTDTGCPFCFHGSNLAEIGLLVKNGFSPMEAIRAGTQTAAGVLGLQEELGTIEEGKLADLIVVEGNPLEDIDLLGHVENIRLIMQGGKFVKEMF